MKSLRRGKKGFSIAVVLIIIVIVSLLGFTAVYMGSENLKHVRKETYNKQAFFAAESGLAQGVNRIRSNNAWNGYEDSPNENQQSFLNVAMPNTSNVTYTVRVYNNLTGANSIAAEEGITVPANRCLIISEGSAPNSTTRKVGVLLQKSNVLDFGLFGKDSLDFRGNIDVDAYDSSLGAYSSSTVVSGEADVGTNGTDSGDINLRGGSNYIDGDMVCGPGADPLTVLSVHPSSWRPTGSYDALKTPKPLPSVQLPAGLGTPQPLPGASSNLLKPVYLAYEEPKYNYHLLMTSRKKPSDDSGDEGDSSGSSSSGTYLNPGYYEAINSSNTQSYVLKNYGTAENPSVYVFDGINLTGGAVLEVDNSNGPVIVYVNGDIDLRGHGALDANLHHTSGSSNPKPTDIRMYATPNCTSVNLRGRSDAFFSLYAPDADVWVHGNVDVFGAAVGKTITFNGNPDFHYDISLRNIDDITVMEVTSYLRF